MAIKASELLTILCDHIKEYGDENVLIYDGYEALYKTFNPSHISRNNKRLVIECANEND